MLKAVRGGAASCLPSGNTDPAKPRQMVSLQRLPVQANWEMSFCEDTKEDFTGVSDCLTKSSHVTHYLITTLSL